MNSRREKNILSLLKDSPLQLEEDIDAFAEGEVSNEDPLRARMVEAEECDDPEVTTARPIE
jgi:hypothetical protein